MSMQGLQIRGLHVAYGRHEILKSVDLDVAPGETLVLFGPSGAGKTVLLRAIAGLEPAARGSVIVGGRDVTALGPEQRGLGMAFQNFALYPHMSARENIASPLRARGVVVAEAEKRVAAVAELLRISHVLDHAPRELSNGQKQRTALARALVGNPHVLLLDDPLRNVDAKLRYEMRLELPRLLRNAGAATIYVSQDYREAMALGDRVAILRDGGIAQCAPPGAIYATPNAVAVARLFGDPPINLLPVRPSEVGGSPTALAAGFEVRLATDRSVVGRDCLLGIRPEAIVVLPYVRPGAAIAEVVATTPLHERLVLLLRAATGEEIVASVVGTPPAPGTMVWLMPNPTQTMLFDATSGAALPRITAPTEKAA